MSEEEQLEYTKETNKIAIYNDLPTDDYIKWLENKEMKEGIRLVIEEEKN